MRHQTITNAPVRLLLSLSAAFAAMVLPVSEAAAEAYEYCVSNPAGKNYGLYTNDVYYAPQCSNLSSEKTCPAREHFFKWDTQPVSFRCASTLTIDFDAPNGPIATLKGAVLANKPSNTMRPAVDVKFGGLRQCASTDAVLWQRKWARVPYGSVTKPASIQEFEGNLWCFSRIEDADGIVDDYPLDGPLDDGGFGGPGSNMNQSVGASIPPSVGVLQFGWGGDGVTLLNSTNQPVIGGYAKFPVTGRSKPWELNLTLSDRRPVTPPIVANDDGTYEATEGESLQIDAVSGLLANDTGIQGSATVECPLAGSGLPEPLYGDVSCSNDGSFTYNADDNATYGDEPEDKFAYRVTDSLGRSDIALVTVLIKDVNESLVAGDDGYPDGVEIAESSTAAATVGTIVGLLANDAIIQGPDATTVVCGTDAGAAGLAQPDHGTVTCTADANGSATYTANDNNFTGADEFEYRVTDGSGDTDVASVKVQIVASNDAPVAVADPDGNTPAEKLTTQEGTALRICADVLLANDDDVDTAKTSLSIESVDPERTTSPAGGKVKLVDDATCLPSGKAVDYDPAKWSEGSDTFTYRISDGQAVSEPATVTVTLTPPIFDIAFCPTDPDQDSGTGDGNSLRKDCTICWFGGGKTITHEDGTIECVDKTFTTTFKDEDNMQGRITLDGRFQILDPRPHCGGNGIFTGATGYTLEPIDTAPAGQDSNMPGLRIIPAIGSGPVEIPWYICGMPGGSEAPTALIGKPFVRLVNANADFLALTDQFGDPTNSFRDIVNSVVLHDADGETGSQNPDYACIDDANPADDGVADPIVAWLPRTDEIPYVATVVEPTGNPARARLIRDITFGCGSARGGTSTRSYLLSNLVYFDGNATQALDDGLTAADYRAIIREELNDMEATLLQPGRAVAEDGTTQSSCVDAFQQNVVAKIYPQPDKVTGKSQLAIKLLGDFDAQRYSDVIATLEDFLSELRDPQQGNIGGLYSAFDRCYYKDGPAEGPDGKIYHLPEFPATAASCNVDGVTYTPCYPPAGSLYIPRNFRGDLEAQAQHIIWNLKQKLIPLSQ